MRQPVHLLCVALLLSIPTIAYACNACVVAQLCYGTPGSLLVALVSTAWFFLNITLLAKMKYRPPLTPSFLIGTLVVGLLTFSAVFSAWLFFLFLSIPCVIAWIWAFTPATKSYPRKTLFALRIIGLLALLILMVGIPIARHQARLKSRIDYILEKSGTVLLARLFGELRAEEPRSLVDYRRILHEGDDFVANRAARRLAVVGDPTIDVPLLIDALERFSEDQPYPRLTYQIRKALSKLSGLALPNDATPDLWRSQWQQKTIDSSAIKQPPPKSVQ